jgi:hypothetical protein
VWGAAVLPILPAALSVFRLVLVLLAVWHGGTFEGLECTGPGNRGEYRPEFSELYKMLDAKFREYLFRARG